MKCLKKGVLLNPQDPDIFKAVVEFYTHIDKESSLDPLIQSLITDENLLNGKTLLDYIDSWVQKATTVHQLWISWLILESNQHAQMHDKSKSYLDKITPSSPGMSHEVFCFL